MAKTIKFNLILDERPVRDLDDLRNNFIIEDILSLYHNGLLQKWLAVRGYNDLLTKVTEIQTTVDYELIYELIKVFEIEVEDKKIKEAIKILQYTNEKIIKLKEFEKLKFNEKDIIKSYHEKYNALLENIYKSKNNMSQIKAIIYEIDRNYIELFKLSYVAFYKTMIDRAPLAIFAILMNPRIREYFIAKENSNEDKKFIFNHLKSYIYNKSTLKEKLGKELKVYKGTTDEYWRDIEPKESKCLIISMESGNFLRNAGQHGKELSANDINDAFLITDGIDYKSRYSSHELLYMEV